MDRSVALREEIKRWERIRSLAEVTDQNGVKVYCDYLIAELKRELEKVEGNQ